MRKLLFVLPLCFACAPLLGAKKLFVLLGQSNMAGRAPTEAQDFGYLSRVFLLDNEDQFVPARNPLNDYSSIRKKEHLQRLSPGYAFAEEMSLIYPADSIYLIVNARGGTSISDFMKGAPTSYYELTMRRIRAALDQDSNLELSAIIWHQGESDRDTPETYFHRFSKLVGDYRTDLKVPDLSFFIGEPGHWRNDFETIRAVLENIPERIPDVWFVSSEGLSNVDAFHFDSHSQRELGKRYARKYAEIFQQQKYDQAYWLKRSLLNPDSSQVMVVAHRGMWRYAPENSIPAIERSIQAGVDMVEVDVALTKDSVLILMHDKTLDRTTTGSGEVSAHTWDEIQRLYLTDGLGGTTPWKVPTLEEVMRLCQGQILVNLDKADQYIERIYAVLKQTNTVDQVAIGSYKTLSEMRQLTGTYLDSIYFMPKLKEGTKDAFTFLNEYFSEVKVPVVQVKFETEDAEIRSVVPYIHEHNKWVWINTISADRSAGHDDNRALSDPDGSFGWVIENGYNMIQTDRPALLLEYLKRKKLHR